METIGTSVEQDLERFEQGPTLTDRTEAASRILARRSLAKVVATTQFKTGLDAIVAIATSELAGDVRLQAIAQLVRLGQAYAPLRKSIKRHVIQALIPEVPKASQLTAASDRSYLAKALAWTKADWIAAYSATAIAEEATAERVRGEFMKVLFANADTLQSVLTELDRALAILPVDVEEPADFISKRLARILSAFRTTLAISRLGSGDAPGAALTRLTNRQFDRFGTNVSEETRRALVKEIILTTHALVRSRFSLASDGATYGALKSARAKLAHKDWPRGIAESSDLLAEVILEAILLLAKQDIVSPELRRVLEITTDGRRSDILLNTMASVNPGLAESVRAWLARRPEAEMTNVDHAVRRQGELDSDQLVGECLLTQAQATDIADEATRELSPFLSHSEPRLAAIAEKTIASIGRLSSDILALAQARNLTLLGSVGERITFNRKYFQSLHDAATDQMKIERPAVVRTTPDGDLGEAVIKGIVK